MQVKDVPAIVTGGASGLGAATARALAAAGAKVAIFDRDIAAAETLAGELGALAVECDVTSPTSAEAAVARLREDHGPCGIAVNCAGIAPAGRVVGREGPLPLEEFDRVIQVNLIGSFNILRLAAAEMAERDPNDDGERGVIISTASVAAYEGQIGQAAYAASKGGIVSMTLPVARELARIGVRVLAIAPGLFATPMLLGMPASVQESLAATLPFPRRFGMPEEFASMVLHMIDNPVMNGTTVRLDSALRMQAK